MVIFGNTEGFTSCHDLLFTPENVMKYTCDKLNKEKLDLYDSPNEFNGEPYILKYENKQQKCYENKDLSNPLSASDIYYNENRPYPDGLPFFTNFNLFD